MESMPLVWLIMYSRLPLIRPPLGPVIERLEYECGEGGLNIIMGGEGLNIIMEVS